MKEQLIILFTVIILIQFSTSVPAQQWPVEVLKSNLTELGIRAGDFDNDGQNDFAVLSNNTLSWFQNEINGWNEHFIDSVIIADYGDVLVFDIDLDDDLDIVFYTKKSAGKIWWYENKSNGVQWVKRVICDSIDMACNIIGNGFSDIDSDGDIDMAVSSSLNGEIFWFENLAPGNLWKRHLIGDIGGLSLWITLSDIDGDNDVDVVSADGNSGTINWYENSLPTSNWISHLVGVSRQSVLGLCSDIDNDGDEDIITHSWYSKQLKWYENPTWDEHLITEGLTQLQPGPICDIDLDGDLDVFYGSQDAFGWCRNLGNSIEWERLTIDSISNSWPSPTCAADIDGDNGQDIILYTFNLSSRIGDVRWYKNPLSIINVPGGYAKIQDAINSAGEGNIIIVDEGTYYENINFMGKAITLSSKYLVDKDTTHISKTIIDGSQHSNPDSGSVVYFISGEDTNSVLTGFTITGGSGTFVPSGAPPDPPFNIRAGGGIFIGNNSGASLIQNSITNNKIVTTEKANGGGVFIGIGPGRAHTIIKGNNIRNNEIKGEIEFTAGGGIFIGENSFVFRNNITNNKCFAINNDAVGGGIRLLDPGIYSDTITCTIINNNISNNFVQSENGRAFAGGLNSSGISLKMNGNQIMNNIVQSNTGSYGAGMHIGNLNYGLTRIEHNHFKNNLSLGTGDLMGGGIFMVASNPYIIKNLFEKNDATFGGAFYVKTADSAHTINNTLVGNTALHQGGGIYSDNSILIIENSILWENEATFSGSQIYQNAGSTLEVLYSDIENGWMGIGNIDENPQFSDTLFHLSSASPCVDAGNPYHECYDEDGSRNDMGYIGGIVDSLYKYLTDLIEISEYGNLPEDFELSQNYPNPFNPSTTIEFNIPKISDVKLKIYNVLGQLVATLVNKELQIGKYKFEWEASDYSSGVYFYQLKAGVYQETRKMVLMK